MTVPEALVGRLTPEQELLLLCARTRFAGPCAARAASLVANGPDWDALLELARTHGVQTLLARRLAGIPGTPAAASDRLTEAARAVARRSTWLTAELLGVLDLLAGGGIDALAYKGPVLGAEAWGDPALRPFADLDLLVAPEQFAAAAAALRAAGLVAGGIGAGRQLAAHLEHAWEVELSNDRGLVVDLHRGLVARHLARGPHPRELFNRSRSVSVDGRSLPTLGRGDTLVGLCLGGASELWSRLKAVVDVAELLQATADWDWPILLDRAHSDGTVRMLLLGVALGCDHAGVPLPEPAAARLAAEPTVLELRQRVWQRLFARGDAPPGYLERNRFWLAARDRPGDRVASLWLRMWTPTFNDWRFVRLPDSLYPLYYLIRPARLVWHALTRWLPEAVRRRG
jgi:hypothetical protein